MLKKTNRIEPNSKNRTQSPEKFNQRISHVFSHQSYVTFLTICYSCHQNFRTLKKTKIGSCCCTLKEQLFYPFLVMSFVLSGIWLFLWIESSNEYNGFDWVVFLGTGQWIFWSIIFLSLAGIMTAYSSLLLLLGFLLIWEGIRLYLHWCHKILILLVILLCLFFMSLLRKLWPDRWLVAGQSLQVIAPYVHLCSVALMVILSWPLALYMTRLEREVRRHKMTPFKKKRLKRCNILTRLRGLQVAIGLPFLLILLCLYLMPLRIYSPCIQEKEDLGPKPFVFGHRGAPMLGPENTMMSFEKAVEHGANGLETDIHISYDDVPFLMHDYDLRRTTNIMEVLPDAAFTHPALFNWSVLSTLNAGEWFVQPQRRPFFNMKRLSEEDKKRARNQSIPKLADLLKLAKKEKKFVIFDLYGPPPKHPFRNTFVRQVVKVILASKIEQQQIFWLPSHDMAYVKYMAPGFQHIGRTLSIENLTRENVSRINVDYKDILFSHRIRDYIEANIKINLYIINEPWLFSLAWCSSINSVTTDNISLLSQINHPYFFMTPKFYMFLWLLTDTVSAIFIFAIFYFYWQRETKIEQLFKISSIHTGATSTSQSEGASHLPTNPPDRMQSPWSLDALDPAITKNSKEYPNALHLGVPSKKPAPITNTVKPLKPATHDIQPPAPSTGTQALSWKATNKAAFQTTLPAWQVDKPIIPSIGAFHPEIGDPQETTRASSSHETYTTVQSTISSSSSSSEHL
ncbi:glycerophosphodiester phosphodiesterase domain-containing protein 4 [Nycticebus coucang]|uniref:glycerophosphodiester phosphodiesterase domain-containing protein 4 n=1 Tax=Nycticebus coucang TaxID=9470 RepID=UPI00234CA626|nr:glycerophosphodiester phosphodiesterase domain-containing protein 4 [Nycticebus coucang]